VSRDVGFCIYEGKVNGDVDKRKGLERKRLLKPFKFCFLRSADEYVCKKQE
jgi:hypothetical protein